jgi:hypothetical protein
MNTRIMLHRKQGPLPMSPWAHSPPVAKMPHARRPQHRQMRPLRLGTRALSARLPHLKLRHGLRLAKSRLVVRLGRISISRPFTQLEIL